MYGVKTVSKPSTNSRERFHSIHIHAKSCSTLKTRWQKKEILIYKEYIFFKSRYVNAESMKTIFLTSSSTELKVTLYTSKTVFVCLFGCCTDTMVTPWSSCVYMHLKLNLPSDFSTTKLYELCCLINHFSQMSFVSTFVSHKVEEKHLIRQIVHIFKHNPH